MRKLIVPVLAGLLVGSALILSLQAKPETNPAKQQIAKIQVEKQNDQSLQSHGDENNASKQITHTEPAKAAKKAEVNQIESSSSPTESPSRSSIESGRQSMNVIATAYCPMCTGSDITATGTKVRPGVIAVDPSVIPYGTEVLIEGYGRFIAEDTGGAIKGNRIDIYMECCEEMTRFGRRELTIWF